MSYSFYSFWKPGEHSEQQWIGRTGEGEEASCDTRTLLPIFEKYLPGDVSKAKIIEAGCGMGGWVRYYSKKGYDIIGIEYDRRIVDRAKAHDPSVPIAGGDIMNLEFPDSYFDAYISLGVIEHFQEGPMEALLEAKRVLKPGGLAFITVPYLSLFRRFFAHPLRDFYFLIRRLKRKEEYFWEYRYTRKELGAFLRKAGYEVIFTGIDDYVATDDSHHIGLYADFYFLRAKDGDIWELNKIGKSFLSALRKLRFSPWFYCSGIQMVAKNRK